MPGVRSLDQFHPHSWSDGHNVQDNEVVFNTGNFQKISQPTGNGGEEPTNGTHRKKTVVSNYKDKHGTYFNDGSRRIDFVLVYDESRKKCHENTLAENRREFFIHHLRIEGIDVETEQIEEHGETMTFVKLHAPFKALCRMADHMKIEMPLKIRDDPVMLKHHPIAELWSNFFNCYYCTKVGQEQPDHDESVIYHPFDEKDINIFDIGNQEEFFTEIQRNEIVWEILQQIPNHPEDDKLRGIESLVEHGIFESAYPVHGTGSLEYTEVADGTPKSLRQVLRNSWATWKRAFYLQPIHKIRRYFGEKIGFYYLFMDFYLKQLVFPSLVGFIVFLIGMTDAWKDPELNRICNETDIPGKYYMCPICAPPNCEAWKMSDEGCKKYKWEYALDNEATLALSCIVMLWAILFVKFWKRREATIASQWHTINFKEYDLTIRPEYEERAPTTRKNPITMKIEPHIPVTIRVLSITFSLLTTFVILAIAGCALTGLVVSRVALYAAFKKGGDKLAKYNVEFSRWFVHLLIFIMVTVSEKVYSCIVSKLTCIECPRTHHSFMTSLLWKLFVFELVNECVPIFYAAFLKSKTVPTPIQLSMITELCDGGCMGEVVELVFVLLFLRLLVGNALELGLPLLKNCIKRRQTKNLGTHRSLPQWLKDFYLNEVELDGVYEDYMEMMIQFAFVVLFIPAFPLGPLLCLINNILEIRVDAIKMLTANRRPVPVRVPGIQIWNKFLDVIVKFGVLVNASLIAFTSDVVPRLFYEYRRNFDDLSHSLYSHNGFTAWSLSNVSIADWHDEHKTEEMEKLHIEECWYIGYRENIPLLNYPHKPDYWRINAIRLIAFAVYSVVFYVIMWLVNSTISDIPSRVSVKVARQAYIAKKRLNEVRRKLTHSNCVELSV